MAENLPMLEIFRLFYVIIRDVHISREFPVKVLTIKQAWGSHRVFDFSET